MKQSRTIIAIGGGEIGRLLPNGTHAPTSTLLIEQEIVRRAKKPTPRLLFIPTATDDHT
ncbi:MAG TPA: hypothetical protein PK765_07145 [bacterium]|nr:hypothetical protein [bacterium]